MNSYPFKDMMPVVTGFLVVGILIFLAWQCTLLSNSLSHHRQVIRDRDARWQSFFDDSFGELKANTEVCKTIQQEVLKNREMIKDNSATLKRNEQRLFEIEQEIKRLPSPHPGQ